MKLINNLALAAADALAGPAPFQPGWRQDRAVVLIVVALALIAAVGLAVAWWIACGNQGGYPAFDMPSWQSGGTWKFYCAL